MITFSYLTIFLLLAILSTIFDMRIFDYTFLEAMRNLLFSEIATGRMIIIFTVLIGLATSAAADFRLMKARKKNRPS
ncbi:hypothetical protein ACOSZF_04825 [Cytobacillus firmus]|uniref:hypothetical protein n=1 Tax=Cytobacillus firmus TaxID=1399 RepID=UPI00157FC056|nr:hypothetical protein [Cytobacillus firmus]MBG9548858.1 hypothetical protein [Cytobacillus firmus]MBG9602277.1 hypothetical protein [Cytobacillus firmus]MBG9657604.1 hypothetical protein [Cytobacillus firmus]MDD9313601.1 hypothetical protein [Cytobacillus firmus]MED1906239.1 hypothetical protein [Cytobacillus firmus]